MSAFSSQRPYSHHHKSPLSKSTLQFFQSKSTLDQITNQFFLPKQSDYNENVLQFYSSTNNFLEKQIYIPNQQGEELYASLFYKSHLMKLPQTCIVYCHGFGSTRLESVHILKVLKQAYGLCCFDFSGSGKSEGQIITYGAKQKQDIYCVIQYLKIQLGFKNFILWGRSMGATACLLYSLKYQKNAQLSNQGVIFQIVDSPFVSFQRIAVEMGKKFASIPQFGTNIVLDIMKKNCLCLKQYDPFTVSLFNIHECKTPTLFIYSENDEIVSSKNTEQLCSKFTSFFAKIIITQMHNVPRPTQILSEIMKKIEIQVKKYEINKKAGLTFRDFKTKNSTKSKSSKKGIQRSLSKQGSKIQQIRSAILSNRNSDYGLKIQSKCQTPHPHKAPVQKNIYQKFQNKKSPQKNTPNFTVPSNDYELKDHPSVFVNFSTQSPEVHKIKNLSNHISQQPLNQENIYQMKKPQFIMNSKIKNLKRHSSPLQLRKFDNPLTNFVRQETNFQNYNSKTHRQNRRDQSTPRKLNISLSKFKSIRQKINLAVKVNQPCEIHNRQLGLNCLDNRDINTSIRPYSAIGDTSSPKSPYQTTAITRNSSLSSSMDNLHILGYRGQNYVMRQNRSEFINKNSFIASNQRSLSKDQNMRTVKKMKSSQIIYYNKNAYRYGI